jgi:hypothetical protein
MKQIEFEGKKYNVIDETPTHYICEPESLKEGYYLISK